MKITKQSTNQIALRKEMEYELILENNKGKEMELRVNTYYHYDDYDYDNEANFFDLKGSVITEGEIRAFLGKDDEDYSDDYDNFIDFVNNGCPDEVNSAEELEESYQDAFNTIIKLWKDGDPEPLDGDEVETLCVFIRGEINKIEANN